MDSTPYLLLPCFLFEIFGNPARLRFIRLQAASFRLCKHGDNFVAHRNRLPDWLPPPLLKLVIKERRHLWRISDNPLRVAACQQNRKNAVLLKARFEAIHQISDRFMDDEDVPVRSIDHPLTRRCLRLCDQTDKAISFLLRRPHRVQTCNLIWKTLRIIVSSPMLPNPLAPLVHILAALLPDDPLKNVEFDPNVRSRNEEIC